jgi:pimeloyl-ACP methyl ester carboxylesterase
MPGQLNYTRRGSGEPLVLIHPLGAELVVWEPVMERLARDRDVIAVDLPGFGDSPGLVNGDAPTPHALAGSVAGLLDRLGIRRAHVAGNSLGGWTALELAKLDRALSVVALGPAGLWARGPIRPMVALALPHLGARRFPGVARRAMRTGAGRAWLLRHAFGHPERVPAHAAVRIAADLANAPGFLPALVATHTRRFSGGRTIEVPVTVAFGALDRVVPAGARRRDELPAQTVWVEPPELGHVPMWDDPHAVASLILGER